MSLVKHYAGMGFLGFFESGVKPPHSKAARFCPQESPSIPSRHPKLRCHWQLEEQKAPTFHRGRFAIESYAPFPQPSHSPFAARRAAGAQPMVARSTTMGTGAPSNSVL